MKYRIVTAPNNCFQVERRRSMFGEWHMVGKPWPTEAMAVAHMVKWRDHECRVVLTEQQYDTDQIDNLL